MVPTSMDVLPTHAINHECFYEPLRYWLWGVVGNIIAIAGLLGNVLTLLTLWRMTPKTSVLVFITAVCVSDAIILLNSSIFVLSNNAFGYLDKSFINATNRGYPALYYFSEVFRYLNTYLTLALCIDRYITVCHPSKEKSTKKRSIISIVIIIIVDIIFNFPKVFEFQAIQDDPKISDCLVTNETAFANTDSYQLVYLSVFDPCFGFLFPLVTMIVLTILTIKTLKKSKFGGLAEAQRAKSLRATNRVSWMCVSVIIVYIVCQLPLIGVYGLMAQDEDALSRQPGYTLMNVATILIMLNSSVNFIIYCLISPAFRKVFVKIICCDCLQYRRVALDEASHSEHSKAYAARTRITTVT